ncbi:hypothetical protein GIW81_02075 [Hyphomicrobium sp. xq]|uniref:Uncharacterized protein n=1 Tax=Hyphomicrobium album TaxID=2665159 RepID=A0A6I3KHF5_9HYPH|nr:hypothetical protein [Hyphomicrobium album]MTD93117.1 hypothetical protein [Hyphomicrobium album]
MSYPHSLYELPTSIESISEAPSSQQPLYESDAAGGYTLHAGGRQLQKVRKAIRDAGYMPAAIARPPRGKEPVLDRREWQIALGAASPPERKLLLAAAGRREIRFKI